MEQNQQNEYTLKWNLLDWPQQWGLWSLTMTICTLIVAQVRRLDVPTILSWHRCIRGFGESHWSPVHIEKPNKLLRCQRRKVVVVATACIAFTRKLQRWTEKKINGFLLSGLFRQLLPLNPPSKGKTLQTCPGTQLSVFLHKVSAILTNPIQSYLLSPSCS